MEYVFQSEVKPTVLHDWGSALGLHYARRHETNVKALCLMEFIHPMTWDEWQKPAKALSSIRTPEIGWDLIVNQMLYRKVYPTRSFGLYQMRKWNSITFANPADRKPLWQFPNQLSIEVNPQRLLKLWSSITIGC